MVPSPSGSPLPSLSGRQTGSSQCAGAQAQGPHQGQLPQPAGLRPLPPRREGEFMERGGSPATRTPRGPGPRLDGDFYGSVGKPRQWGRAAVPCRRGLPSGIPWGQVVHPGLARSLPARAARTRPPAPPGFLGRRKGRIHLVAALPAGDSGALLGGCAGGGGAVGILVRAGGFSFQGAAGGGHLSWGRLSQSKPSTISGVQK